jgi:hypothetical protein
MNERTTDTLSRLLKTVGRYVNHDVLIRFASLGDRSDPQPVREEDGRTQFTERKAFDADILQDYLIQRGEISGSYRLTSHDPSIEGSDTGILGAGRPQPGVPVGDH